MLKKIYLSPLGYVISFIQSMLAFLHKPFMVYGYYNSVKRKFMRKTRISSTVKILNKKKLDICDHVWVWHHSILDASNDISIGKGAQIGAWVGIFTHSSHISIRLLGEHYLESNLRKGYVCAPVVIGEYSFIAAGSIILPGVNIGRGVVVAAGSVVNKDIPDYSIVSGNPARVIGNVKRTDEGFFHDESVLKTYFDQELLQSYLKNK